MSTLLIAAAGFVLLAVARITSGSDPITRRPYAKRYSGAPAADYENKPDAR